MTGNFAINTFVTKLPKTLSLFYYKQRKCVKLRGIHCINKKRSTRREVDVENVKIIGTEKK